jgi:esterase/lipase superfamily enzyme
MTNDLPSISVAGKSLMYVHGFNQTFDDAVDTAAQLAEDLNFRGPTIAFSWPSNPGFGRYVEAAHNASPSTLHLAEAIGKINTFLQNNAVSPSTAGQQIIAHSMGAKLVMDTLNAMHVVGDQRNVKLRTLILAAADASRQLFFVRDAPHLQEYTNRALIICSDRDFALSDGSELFEGNDKRLGLCRDYKTVFASQINAGQLYWTEFNGASLDWFGHSYFLYDHDILEKMENQIDRPDD